MHGTVVLTADQARFRLPCVDTALTPGCSIRNTLRSFASLIHAGGRARPLHVAPVAGSRYLGAGLTAEGLATEVRTPFFDPTGLPRLRGASESCTPVSMSLMERPCSAIIFRMLDTTDADFFRRSSSAFFCSRTILCSIWDNVTILSLGKN
jgi:hypothetical protein